MIASIIVKKITDNKYKKLSSVLPFLAGITANLIVCAFSGTDGNFGDEIERGMRTGSAATVLYVIICGFFKEDYVSIPFEALVSESLLAGYVAQENLSKVAEKCAEILIKYSENNDTDILTELTEFLNETIHDKREAEMLAKMLLNVFISTR